MGGQQRNVAFAMLAIGQTIGMTAGYPAGAWLVQEAGYDHWRVTYILLGLLNTVTLVIAIVAVPRSIDAPDGLLTGKWQSWKEKLHRLSQEIDWVGFLLQFATAGTLGSSVIGISKFSERLRLRLCIVGLLTTIVLASCFIL
jgi:predicted MFS family arabinose efflux permease